MTGPSLAWLHDQVIIADAAQAYASIVLLRRLPLRVFAPQRNNLRVVLQILLRAPRQLFVLDQDNILATRHRISIAIYLVLLVVQVPERGILEPAVGSVLVEAAIERPVLGTSTADALALVRGARSGSRLHTHCGAAGIDLICGMDRLWRWEVQWLAVLRRVLRLHGRWLALGEKRRQLVLLLEQVQLANQIVQLLY